MVRKTPRSCGRCYGSSPDSPPTLTSTHLRPSVQGPNNRDDYAGNARTVRTNSLQVLPPITLPIVFIAVPVGPGDLRTTLLLLEHPERTKRKAILEPELHERSILFFRTLHLG